MFLKFFSWQYFEIRFILEASFVRKLQSSNVLFQRKNFVKLMKQYGNPDSHVFFIDWSDARIPHTANSKLNIFYFTEFKKIALSIFFKSIKKNWIILKYILRYGIENNHVKYCFRYEDRRELNSTKMYHSLKRLLHFRIYFQYTIVYGSLVEEWVIE